MFAAALPHDADETQFRELARRCLALRQPPQQVAFVDAREASLLPPLPERKAAPPSITVPRAYSALLADAICHRADDRFALLYEVLWRIAHGERDLATGSAAATGLGNGAPPIRRSPGSATTPTTSAATSTRCMPSCASARGRETAAR